MLFRSFLNDSVLSASPARLLTMLYDRLVLDLDRAGQAQSIGDHADASTHLTHAQDIISELMVTLDVTAWEGGPGLMAIYTHLLGELVRANVHRDADRTAECRSLVEPLRAAWHEAASNLNAAAGRPASGQVPVAVGGILGVG